MAEGAACMSRKKEWSGYSPCRLALGRRDSCDLSVQRLISLNFNALRRSNDDATVYLELSGAYRLYGMFAARLEYGY
jgi:hypothetical protein